MSKSVRVAYDFVGNSAQEMTVHVGERLTVVSDSGDGWLQCEVTGQPNRRGFVPSNYVEADNSAPAPAAAAAATGPAANQNRSAAGSAPVVSSHPHGGPVVMDPSQGLVPKTPWRSGLCGCCDDIASCCDVYFCFLCQASYQHSAIAQETGCGCGNCLATCCCMQHSVMSLRYAVVSRYYIDESFCGTCCTAACCPLCSMCQTHREMRLRGVPVGGCCVGLISSRIPTASENAAKANEPAANAPMK